jgi:hypothetical protein
MDKKSLITLIYRDLYELKVLTSGFSEMKIFPKMLVDLAVDKAENIANCLKKLPLNVDESQAYLDFAKAESQEQEVKTKRVEEKIEIIEKPEIEEKIEAEILNEQQKVEEQIEVEQPQPEIVVEQPKIEEKVEPKIKIPVAKPTLQNKVLDLKQAVSIADRFRFQRELFDGNGENFSKALTDLNEMETLEQAQNYIVENLKFDLENPVIKAFIEILKRKLN